MRHIKQRGVSVQRRIFLKMTAAGAAGIAIASKIDPVFASSSVVSSPGPGNKWPGRVVINFNNSGVTSSGAATDVIKKMVDASILKLTDQTTVGAAWKLVFPSSLGATSKIAIKIPIGFNDGLSCPHWSSVQAIVEGLTKMDFSGTPFPAGNICIYDMSGTGIFATAGYTAARFPGVTIVKDSVGSGYTDGARGIQYATKLKSADFLINVFSPRGHALACSGGFTLGFKNHYGTYASPSSHHDNDQQYLRDINCIGPAYTKTVLFVCSGIYGQNEGNGPQGQPDIFTTYAKKMDSNATTQAPSTIIMSTDPVSCEVQAVKILRINKGGKYTADDMPNYLKASGGKTVSGYSPINNIGEIVEDPTKIRTILNGASTPVLKPVVHGEVAGKTGIVAHQLKGQAHTFVEFMLPPEHAGKDADIAIYSMQGALVQKISQKVLGILNHFSWDEKDARGNLVAKGTYVVRLISGSVQASTKFEIMR